MSYIYANVGFVHRDLLLHLPELKKFIDLNLCIGAYDLNHMVFTADGAPNPKIDSRWYCKGSHGRSACEGIRIFERDDPKGVPLQDDPNYVMFSVSKGN